MYSRSVAHQSRAVDEVHGMIEKYECRVTLGQLMRDNPERLKDPGSVYAAIKLLE